VRGTTGGREGRGIQAIILSGGLGTRLRPITETVPKALVPICGRPFLEYQLEYMRNHGVDDVVLCVGHLGQMIEQHFGDGRAFGLRIRYGYEQDRLLGTAGAVKNVEALLDDIFLVVNGDTYPVVDFSHVMESFLTRDRLGLMVVFKNENRWDRSNVITNGTYVRVYSKDQELAGMVYIDFGVSALRRATLAHIPANEPADMSLVYHALIAQEQLLAYETSHRFHEIGSPEGLTTLP
jgi:NDP-sugar pyrophosphorylase family protein